jgi:hypothetical protein
MRNSLDAYKPLFLIVVIVSMLYGVAHCSFLIRWLDQRQMEMEK